MDAFRVHRTLTVWRIHVTLKACNLRADGSLLHEPFANCFYIVCAKMHNVETFITADRSVNIKGAALCSGNRVPTLLIQDSDNLKIVVLENSAAISCP